MTSTRICFPISIVWSATSSSATASCSPDSGIASKLIAVGLSSSRHRLVGVGEGIEFDFDTKGSPAQQVLGAVYAAATVPTSARHAVATGLHKAMRWHGPLGPAFVSYLSGVGSACAWSARAFADPFAWALDVLGLPGPHPDRQEVLARFRARLREVHPDHGGSADDAGQRILDLTEARRILLG